MAAQVAENFRPRRNFGKIKKVVDIPNLIEIQRRSYDEFLQKDSVIEDRKNVGLQAVFKSVFPIKDFNENAELDFVGYSIGEPKFDIDECHQRGNNFAAPLKVTVHLVIYERDEVSGTKSIKNVKEQEVYFGEIPLMTRNGTFMINGTERVIVSQLHRSPGVFFDDDKGKTHASGKLLFKARIIPYRGSWIDFEFDPRDIIFVRIDRRRKFHATVLLRALGMTTEDLLNYFYQKDTVVIDGAKASRVFRPELHLGIKLSRDVRHPETNEILVKEGRKLTKGSVRQLEQAGVELLPMSKEEVAGKISAHDLADPKTGEIIVETNEEITPTILEKLVERGIDRFEVLFMDHAGPSLRNTMLQDKISSPDEAIIEIYKRLRPGDPPTRETARTFFDNLFFNKDRYDLSKVGRLKLNHKLRQEAPLEQGTLRSIDILEVVRYLIDLKNGSGSTDDIDHLGNRRVRAVGELVENQYRIGLVRMERAIKERMSLQDIETLMPQELINYKPVAAVIKEFFGSSQLSQFMDQTNPLSEVTHKRRLSALGPGGLTRERAGFEVRDVHPTHYGRVCPIETPEGPNIGLIASLSTYAAGERLRLRRDAVPPSGNRSRDGRHPLPLGPRRGRPRHRAGERTDRCPGSLHGGPGLGAHGRRIPPGDARSGRVHGRLAESARVGGGVADPVLENDDANRALMGSNMQRPGGAAPAHGRAARRHRNGARRGARLRGDRARAPRGRGREHRRDARRDPRRQAGQRRHRYRHRHLQPRQVPALEPEHLRQPEADRQGWRSGGRRRRDRGRAGDRARGARARPERPRRLHALGRIQLRGLDPHQRARRQGRPLHLDPHRGVRVRGPRHEARPRGDHARHPERRRGGARHLDESGSSASAPRCGRERSWSAR
jgi:DNA-directed RNA polymerase subunit beta